VAGVVILYTDRITTAIRDAVTEVDRRRGIQEEYNLRHRITPKGIEKPIRAPLVDGSGKEKGEREHIRIDANVIESLTPLDRKKKIAELRLRMRQASKNLEFEFAAQLRDFILKLTT
jgi:excinuclease ABC subunit B